MSMQSSLDTQSPIWQNKDLGPSSTSLAFLNNKTFNLVDKLSDLTIRLAEIEQETTCSISIHGQWIKIKNSSTEARQIAFNLINAATNNSCNEIFLPDVNVNTAEASVGTRLSSPSPPPPVHNEPITIKSTAQKIKQQTTLTELPKRKSGLTRSSTDTQISSLQQSKTVSPFSNMLPVSPKSSSISNNVIIEEERPVDANNNEITESTITTKKSENKHRYSVDFLLLRSDMANSKKLPSNWKELNEIFPSICFCGKVLSYFNPYKYHEHWEKTKNQNYELHNSSCEPQRYPYYKTKSIDNHNNNKAQTDDYINLQTTLRDFHNVNYPNKSYRNNYNYDNPTYKKHQLPFEMRQQQNHNFYQQENQIKRKHQRVPNGNFSGQKA